VIGSIINASAVIIGGLIGLIVHSKLPRHITQTTFQAIGLFTIVLGITMAIKTTHFLAMVISLVLGAIIGSSLDIESKITLIGEFLKKKSKSKNKNFSEGFITAFMLYCMGSLTILGSIEEGLGNPPTLLLSKSILDGFSSIALAASMGAGVIFSAIPLLIYQGSITIITSFFQQSLSEVIITELSAVGGILLVGLGIDILNIKKISILNMIPSLLIILILVYLFY
jgi:uncharacterized membrane protein YqgA involved in biofilm formation